MDFKGNVIVASVVHNQYHRLRSVESEMIQKTTNVKKLLLYERSAACLKKIL